MMLAIRQMVSSPVSVFFGPAGIHRNIQIPNVMLSSMHDRGEFSKEKDALFQLKDRVKTKSDSPFIQWIQLNNRFSISLLKISPQTFLIWAHLPNLIYKVMLATAAYMTRKISLHASLTYLLSQSQLVATVALPILNQISSFPIPPILLSVPVMVLTPIIFQLTHMALIQLSAGINKQSKVIERIKQGVGVLNQGVDFFWNLRLTCLCLGMSQTVILSILYTSLLFGFSAVPIVSYLALRFFSFNPKGPNFVMAMSRLITLSILNLCIPCDKWPTMNFSLSFKLTYHSLVAPSQPYDIQVVENLFNQVQAVQNDVRDLNSYRASIDTCRQNINTAQNEGKISPTFANQIRSLLYDECYKSLKNILVHTPSLNDSLKPIYGPQGVTETLQAEMLNASPLLKPFLLPQSDWKNFLTGLRLVKGFNSSSPKNELEQKLQKLKITEQQYLFLESFLDGN